MIEYNKLFHNALTAYKNKAERIPITTLNGSRRLPYRYEWTSSFLSYFDNDKIYTLQYRLTKEPAEAMQRLEIKYHFMTSDDWQLYSFNNYLLDEIRKHSTEEEWNKHWKLYDKYPIFYYKGLLYKTTTQHPKIVFEKGIFEKERSQFIDDYITDSNDTIGVATTRLFHIARDEATHTSWFSNFFSKQPTSYLYIIDYQDNDAILLTPTLEIQGRDCAAKIPREKDEVNIINGIMANQFIGAFKVSRNPVSMTWLPNENYKGHARFIDTLTPQFQELVKIGNHIKSPRHC